MRNNGTKLYQHCLKLVILHLSHYISQSLFQMDVQLLLLFQLFILFWHIAAASSWLQKLQLSCGTYFIRDLVNSFCWWGSSSFIRAGRRFAVLPPSSSQWQFLPFFCRIAVAARSTHAALHLAACWNWTFSRLVVTCGTQISAILQFLCLSFDAC